MKFHYYAYSNFVMLAGQMLLQKTYSICTNILNGFSKHGFGKERKREREVERESKTELVVLIFPFALGSQEIFLGVALFP